MDVKPGEVDLSHPGKCYCNSRHGPAEAEEVALGRVGKALLNLPDDEAIFANDIISDGDTRGPLKFITAQLEVIGPAASGIVGQKPDLNHKVKTVSNGLYDLANKNLELRGANLLEAPRIRVICGDLTRHLRTFHDILQSSLDTVTISKARDACLCAIDAIIPHHCGDHSLYTRSNCLYKKLELDVGAFFAAMDQTAMTKEFKQEVNRQYAEKARFKGVCMSISLEGRKKIAKVITSRVNEHNIDLIAELKSNNNCENYFTQIIKHTKGKRRYLGQKNGLHALTGFIAAKSSNPDISAKIMSKLGVVDCSWIRKAQ
jgi:hypothetical protein